MKGTMINRFLLTIALFCCGAATMMADESTYIKSVLNGTTLVTESGDTVKLIGVRPWDTENMGEKELQDYLEILVGGVKVTLVEDEEIDAKGGTRFCYVNVGGTMVNQHLISEGYAQATTTMRFSKAASFVAAETSARVERLGRWAIDDQYAGVALGTNNEKIATNKSLIPSGATTGGNLSGLLK
jgi:micrococcal nuclease